MCFSIFRLPGKQRKKNPNNVVFFLRNWIFRSFLQDFVSFSLNSLEGSTVSWPVQSLANTAWFYHFPVLWDISHTNVFLYSLWLSHPLLNFHLISCHSLCNGRGGSISHPKATCYGICESIRYLELHPTASPSPSLLLRSQEWDIKEETMLFHSSLLPANNATANSHQWP